MNRRVEPTKLVVSGRREPGLKWYRFIHGNFPAVDLEFIYPDESKMPEQSS